MKTLIILVSALPLWLTGCVSAPQPYAYSTPQYPYAAAPVTDYSYAPTRGYHRGRVPAYSHQYYTGRRGGCYYINSRGNKQYVDRSLCR